MRNESGRSLIEVIGVMAIAGVMTVSALGGTICYVQINHAVLPA